MITSLYDGSPETKLAVGNLHFAGKAFSPRVIQAVLGPRDDCYETR